MSSFAEFVSVVTDIVVALVAIAMYCVAREGLLSWKRELIGKENLEVARNVLRTAYSVRDSIKECREPFVDEYEFPEDYDRYSNSPNKRADGHAYVYDNRFKSVRRSYRAFDAAVLEAEVLWGSEVQIKADEIRSYGEDLYWALGEYIDNIRSDGVHFQEDADLMAEVREAMNQKLLMQKMNHAIAGIEKYVRPHLNPRA